MDIYTASFQLFAAVTQLYFRKSGIMKFWESLNTFKSKVVALAKYRKNDLHKINQSKPISYNSIVFHSLLIFASFLYGLAVIAFLVETKCRISYWVYALLYIVLCNYGKYLLNFCV